MKARKKKTIDRQEEESLSVKDLASRIPLSAGTIRNKISQGEFVQGRHYFKPGGTVIFKWSRVVEWIEKEDKSVR